MFMRLFGYLKGRNTPIVDTRRAILCTRQEARTIMAAHAKVK